jgi:AraC-like DNA-binding protein
MGAIPMVQAGTIIGMPEFLLETCGEKALARANATAQLPGGLPDDPERYIPWSSLMRYLDAIARETGAADIGLELLPYLTVASWGTWGGYVCSAPTLDVALKRMSQAMHLHGNGDQLKITIVGDEVMLDLIQQPSGEALYPNVAFCAAGLLLGTICSYLGQDWRPNHLQLDIPRRRTVVAIEDALACEVRLGAAAVSVTIPRDVWMTPAIRRQHARPVTMRDVCRARFSGPPRDLPEAVAETVRVQLIDAAVSFEQAAKSLDLGPRSLQRMLADSGTNFRSIATHVRMCRARELLCDPTWNVTRVSADLGYSSPAHFGRAFAKEVGMTPRAFRHLVCNVTAPGA